MKKFTITFNEDEGITAICALEHYVSTLKKRIQKQKERGVAPASFTVGELKYQEKLLLKIQKARLEVMS